MATLAKNPRSPEQAAALRKFGRNLTDALLRAGMSQADLARALWGSTQEAASGRDVARNRDRISLYCRGLQMPEPKTVGALAKALGVSPDDLIPMDATRPANARRAPEPGEPVRMAILGDNPGMSRLQVDMTMPTALAAQIVDLLAKAQAAERDGAAPQS